MIKKIFTVFTLCLTSVFITGCDLIKRDSMENIDIYTTDYATFYITERLYGEHSTIHSIYPNGVDITSYKLTNKQIKDYSQAQLYIFNGLDEKEKSYVDLMRKENDRLRIIDTTLSMEYTNGAEELWLDPSNFLMMAQNIKKGFAEYINNYYLNNDIKNNYEQLKIDASNLDARIKKTVQNADEKTILVADDMFKYLSKYGLNVYSIDPDTVNGKTTAEVNDLINSGEIEYVIVKDDDADASVKAFMKENNLKQISWKTLANISEEDNNNKRDYFSIMSENIEEMKNELYK